MTLDVLTVALLAAWSLTQLATRDVITAGPRLRLRRWIRARAHRDVFTPYATNAGDRIRLCSCGYEPDDLDAFVDHIVAGRAEAQGGWLYKLVTCPWCVSFYIAGLVGLSAEYLGDTRLWRLAAFALGARVLAGALVTYLGPPPDDNEDIADDPL